MIFLVLFVFIPLVELYFMLQVSDEVGAFNTVLLVVLTAVIGGIMVRLQGFSTLLRVREMSARGEVPAIEVMEGVILLACGVMLLLPGFITDALGFLLLVPPIRRMMVIYALKRSNVLRSPGSNQFSQGEYSADYTVETGEKRKPRVIDADDWEKEN